MDRQLGVVPTPDEIAGRKRSGSANVLGYKAWTFDPAMAFAGAPLVIGNPYFGLAEIPEAEVISNIHFAVTGAASGLNANSGVAIFQGGKPVVKYTGAAIQSALQTAGFATIALPTPTRIEQGSLQIGVLPVGGNNPPSLLASVADAGGVTYINNAGANKRGVFDVGSSGVFGDSIANAFAGQSFWLAVS